MWMTWAFNPGFRSDGVVTVEVQGTPASAALLVLAEDVAQLASAGTTVVVDLDDLVLTSSSAMRGFIARLHALGGGDVILSCRRPTGRQLLRRWGAGSIPVVAGGADDGAGIGGLRGGYGCAHDLCSTTSRR